MKKLHLHIGMPKCASTFLQAFFLSNNDLLKSMGHFYPIRMSPNAHGNLQDINLSIKNKLVELTKESDYYRKESLSEKERNFCVKDATALFEEIIDPQISTPYTILSSENLWKLESASLRFLTSKFGSVKVHIVLRPKIELVESLYNQRVKTGVFKFDINSILRNRKGNEIVKEITDYSKISHHWVKEFGKGNVFYHYLSSDMPPIQEQVLKSMGIVDFSDFEVPAMVNESISCYEALTLCCIPEQDKKKIKKKRAIISRSIKKLGLTKKKPHMEESLINKLNLSFVEDNSKFVTQQENITLDRLQEKKTYEALTFEEMSKSQDFIDLHADLENNG